jgi:hypothetical protein
VTKSLGSLHKEENYNLCCSPDIIRIIKSRLIILEGLAANRSV